MTDVSNPDDGIPGGGSTSSGPNRYTDKGTTVDDVSPLDDRVDGTSQSAQDQRESLDRQKNS